MPWGRVDDDFYDHPKVLALGGKRLPCVGLYFLAISWSNRYLSDGRLSPDRVRMLGGSILIAERLVDAGLFDRDGDCYLVHDFLSRNKSRAQVESEREQKAEAGRMGGLARAGKVSKPEADAKQSAKQEPSTLLSTIQAPGASPRPVPSESESSTPTTPKSSSRKSAGRSRETEPRLTKAQLETWATFTDPAWQPFKAAWLARGFLHPPFGEAGDDPDTSQRARLWRIAEDQPQALSRWVAEAPGKTAHEVIAYVFEQRAKLAAEVGAEEAEATEATPQKREGMVPVAEVLADWLSGGSR